MAYQVVSCEFIGNSLLKTPNKSVEPPDVPSPLLAGSEYFKQLGMEHSAIDSMYEDILEIIVPAEDITNAKAEVRKECELVVRNAVKGKNLTLHWDEKVYRIQGGQHGIGFWIEADGKAASFESKFPDPASSPVFVTYPMIIVRIKEVE